MLAEAPGASCSRRRADQPLGLVEVVQFSRLAQRLADAGMQGLGDAVGDVAGLMDLATLDWRIAGRRC